MAALLEKKWLLLGIGAFFAWIHFRRTRALKNELREALAGKARAERLRDEERIGRTKAQRLLNNQVDLVAAAGMEPIGYLESVYRRRFGTPRQGAAVPSGRAILRLNPRTQPIYSTMNMDEYSHVWLIYLFHENTNATRSLFDKSVTNAKVRPPRLGGGTVGLFSTRTPHRPNPIGLSLVKLDKVEDGVLYLSGIDVCNKTPILDVKPYLPYSDSVAADVVRVAEWVTRPVVSPMKEVQIEEDAMKRLESLKQHIYFYSNVEEFVAAVKEILEHDIRSEPMRISKKWRYSTMRFRFDNFRVCFRVDDIEAEEEEKVPAADEQQLKEKNKKFKAAGGKNKICRVVDFELVVDGEGSDDEDEEGPNNNNNNNNNNDEEKQENEQGGAAAAAAPAPAEGKKNNNGGGGGGKKKKGGKKTESTDAAVASS